MSAKHKHPSQPEFFYWKDKQRADAALHDPIIAGGDHAKAESISRKVAKRLGLSDDDYSALLGGEVKQRRRAGYDPGEDRDEHGRWSGGGSDSGGDGVGGVGGQFVSASPKEFITARDKSTRQQFLSPLKPDDLSGHTLLTNKDKTVGAAIDQHGDLQNVFNNGGPKGAAADVIVAAIGKGARTLDCYDGRLPGYYRQFGFVETSRIKFNPEFAHGWDVEKHGQPDVVFMAWKGYVGGDAKGAVERVKSGENWVRNERTSNYATDFDAAKEQSRAVASRTKDHRSGAEGLRASADRAGNQSIARTSAGVQRPVGVKGHYIQDPDTGRFEGSEPGPGHDDGSGGGAPSATVPNYSPGQLTPPHGSMDQAKAVKQSWASRSPIKTMDDAKRLAFEGQKMLNAAAMKIEAPGIEIGYGEDKFTAAKSGGGGEKRVAEKAAQRGGNIGAVADLARVYFTIDHPAMANQVFGKLAKSFETVTEPWRLTEQLYGDRAANVRLPNGLIAEVQVMDRAMADAKHTQHDNYKITRDSKADKNGGRYKEALKAQIRAYGAVLRNHPPDWKAVFDKAIHVRFWLRRR